MRRATVAAVLLGLLAVVSAGDISKPKRGTGRVSCLLPVSKLECIRDWRSGFVAGVRFGYNGFDALPPYQNWLQLCSDGQFNQTKFDMSVASEIDDAQSKAPSWYGASSTDARGRQDFYFYPAGAPITQVIVLHAPNPWGDKWGNIPAILFGYLDGPAGDNQRVDFAVCGNALYANYFLHPDRAPAPPTPVTLKASFSSGLSEGDKFTALGSLDGKCGIRGSGYLGGDPWKSSKLRLLSVKKPCFTPWDGQVTPFPSNDQPPPRRIWGNFDCEDPAGVQCKRPCHFSKKNNKKGPSYSCSREGITLAVGKYGPISFDEEGNSFEWAQREGRLQQVQTELQSAALEGEVIADEDDE